MADIQQAIRGKGGRSGGMAISDAAWDSLRIRTTDGSELKVRVSQVLRNWPEIYRIPIACRPDNFPSKEFSPMMGT